MVKRLISRIGFLVGAVAALTIGTLAVSHPTYAADTSTTGLQLSPAVVNLDGDPGKSYTINIKVKNVTSSTLTFSTTVNDFGAKDETGAPSILLDPTTTLPTSIQSWVENTPDFTLAPQQEQPLSVVVDVPANAEPGGHYGVIRFTGQPTSVNNTSVGQLASAGTLVLVRISGDIKENLQLTTFTAATPQEQEGSFFETGPLKLVERFTNTGNVHVQPVGQIEIRDTFGNHVDTLQVNDVKGNVLPTSVRRFEQDFTKKFLFGRYTANISIAYGTQGEAIVSTTSFWVIPWKLLLIGVLLLATIIYVFIQLVKRYNRFIINRAKQHDKTKKKQKR
jgi:hypothetical protein